ncbi:MAG TPA: class I SAM-dependent methyltransferase [Patescibacteria group bacterium]|nr:class I SAM-dependent methyltransferase [Patescibacteria group bacterium]
MQNEFTAREADYENVETYNEELKQRVIESLTDRYGIERSLYAGIILNRINKFLTALQNTYGDLRQVKGKRILDIGCGKKAVEEDGSDIDQSTERVFEPWMCRILVELGADPVGIDIEVNDDPSFEHYQIDAALPGAFAFLPDHSFDGWHDMSVFGHPKFVKNIPRRERGRVYENMKSEMTRLLKSNGMIIQTHIESLNPANQNV